MIECLYVLVVYFDTHQLKGEYVGHFESCAQATIYLREHEDLYKDRTWDKCLHEDYLFLPKGLVKTYPVSNGKK